MSILTKCPGDTQHPPKPDPDRLREPTRRVFFALWPDEPLRTAIIHATCDAVSACGGRPVPPQHLHVTLAFLGSVPEHRVPELVALARRVADGSSADVAPVPLIFNRLEQWSEPEVLCATAGDVQPSTGASIYSLANRLKQALVNAGFTPDLKSFRPHVTLARKIIRVIHSPNMHPVVWSSTAFALVESHVGAAEPIYRVIESWPTLETNIAKS